MAVNYIAGQRSTELIRLTMYSFYNVVQSAWLSFFGFSVISPEKGNISAAYKLPPVEHDPNCGSSLLATVLQPFAITLSFPVLQPY
jgi:hypothetical protein